MIQSSDKPASSDSIVNLRIEANSSTLWEGPIKSGPRNITVSDGFPAPPYPSFPCDGRPNGDEPFPPGNTATDALDEASKLSGFTYDGSYYNEDFDFTRIGPSSLTFSSETNTSYEWGTLINYQLSPSRPQLFDVGCHDILKPGDEVLWAFIAYNYFGDPYTTPDVSFLKLTPTAVTVKKGKGTTVTVIDGRSGNKTKGAIVAGVKTNASGKATLYFSKPGFYQFKARRTGDVRSNVINITVTH